MRKGEDAGTALPRKSPAASIRRRWAQPKNCGKCWHFCEDAGPRCCVYLNASSCANRLRIQSLRSIVSGAWSRRNGKNSERKSNSFPKKEQAITCESIGPQSSHTGPGFLLARV